MFFTFRSILLHSNELQGNHHISARHGTSPTFPNFDRDEPSKHPWGPMSRSLPSTSVPRPKRTSTSWTRRECIRLKINRTSLAEDRDKHGINSFGTSTALKEVEYLGSPDELLFSPSFLLFRGDSALSSPRSLVSPFVVFHLEAKW